MNNQKKSLNKNLKEYKFIRILSLVILISSISAETIGCECHKVSKIFSARMKTSNFIGLVTIIPNHHTDDRKYLTKCKVDQQYSGDDNGEIIYIRNSNGIDCNSSVRHPVGTQIIIKAWFDENDFSKHELNLLFNKKTERLNQSIYSLSSCLKCILQIEKGMVYGRITESKNKMTLIDFSKFIRRKMRRSERKRMKQ